MHKEFVVIDIKIALGFLKEVRVLSKPWKTAVEWPPAALLSLMFAGEDTGETGVQDPAQSSAGVGFY